MSPNVEPEVLRWPSDLADLPAEGIFVRDGEKEEPGSGPGGAESQERAGSGAALPAAASGPCRA